MVLKLEFDEGGEDLVLLKPSRSSAVLQHTPSVTPADAKVNVMSIPGCAFDLGEMDVDIGTHYIYDTNGEIGDETGLGLQDAFTPILLPDGAVVTKAACGLATGGSWSLKRYRISDGAILTMASGNVANPEDETIFAKTIDNTKYGYYIEVASFRHILYARVEYRNE